MNTRVRQLTVSGAAMDIPRFVKMVRNWDTGWLRHFRGLMIDNMGKNFPVANGAMVINLIDSELVRRIDEGMSVEEIINEYYPKEYYGY